MSIVGSKRPGFIKKHWGKILIVSVILGIISGHLLDEYRRPLALTDSASLSENETRAIELLIVDEVNIMLSGNKGVFALSDLGIGHNITASALSMAYNKNEVAADNNFKGRSLLIEGRLLSIDKDFIGNVILRLQGQKLFMDVVAYMNEAETPWVTKLQKGQTIALICQGDGLVLKSAVLKKCRSQYMGLYERILQKVNATLNEENQDSQSTNLIQSGKHLASSLSAQSSCWQNPSSEDCQNEIAQIYRKHKFVQKINFLRNKKLDI